MNYRTFLDTYNVIPLNEVYKILTKKYYKGRDNRTIHHKLTANISVRRYDTVDFSKFWTRQPQRDGAFGINMFADICVIDGYLSMTLDKHRMMLHTFDIRNEQLLSKDHCVISMDEFNSYGTITEDIFFQLSTVMNLHGLTYNECVAVQKI